jgi:Holliday junction DNA helicase RuvA
MIAYLNGQVIHKTVNYFILDVAGVGYQVFAGENFLNDLKVDETAVVHTCHVIREEASDLYGFKTREDRELFELLLSVSGVGPKSALGVLSLAAAADIKETIIRGDANLLTKVSGIGKKTAERIVLELKTKVFRTAATSLMAGGASLGGGDEIDALLSLGYSLSEARTALNQVDPSLQDSGERLKAALKKMAKK